MSKYIDADLLRKDIDNWKEAMADAVGEYSDGVRFALEHFTFVLDSLQQERPSLPDNLDEVAEKYYIPKDKIILVDEETKTQNPGTSGGERKETNRCVGYCSTPAPGGLFL